MFGVFEYNLYYHRFCCGSASASASAVSPVSVFIFPRSVVATARDNDVAPALATVWTPLLLWFKGRWWR